MEDKENTPPMCLLLPTCVESEFDAFFNILRNAISRSRPDVNYFDNALKIGMTGETITIEPDDIVVDWKDLPTKPKQILQWKLLGFWANQNSPSLGKKLFQPSWKPPQRKCVEVIGGRLITPDEIDVMIARKIKLRVYELSVSQSTFEKLKHFVKVPADVDVYNDERISPKIRSYDIKPEHLKRCYDALRFGKFDDSSNGNVEQTMKVSARVPSTSTSTSCRQKFDDIAPALSTPSSMFSRQKLDAHSGNRLQSDKRARMDLDISETFGGCGCDMSQMVLVEIQNKIDNLTKWLNPSVAGRDGGNGSERLHVMVFRQKDDEIRQMKLTVEKLQMEIENLKKEKSSLEKQVETNTAQINEAKKCVEATSELHVKSESELAASLMTINDREQSIAQYRSTVETLESELRSSKDETAIKERKIEQLKQTIELNIADNTKLEGQLNVMNEKVMELQRHIEHLEKKVSEATASNGKLEANLHEWKNIAATKEREIEQLHKTIESNIADNRKLERQLNVMNEKVMEMVPELQRHIEHLEKNVSEATVSNGKLEANLHEWKTIAATKEREIEQLHKTIESNIADHTKLEGQLNVMNGKVVEMVPELQRRIEDSERDFIEATAENMKLKEELNQLKNCGARSENLALENNTTKCGNGSDNVVNASNDSENNSEMPNESLSSMPEASERLPETLKCRNELEISEKELTRENLKKLKFGWIKFSGLKNCNAAPGFVHPPDGNGKTRARKVTYKGSVALKTNKFVHYSENIPDSQKLAAHQTAIKKFNKKFGFEFE